VCVVADSISSSGADDCESSYSARAFYRNSDVVASYEADRFSGTLGRYRWRREQNAVLDIVKQLPACDVALDAPCGIGRWWPVLELRCNEIVAVDISHEMIETARSNVTAVQAAVELRVEDAEALSFGDESFDLVFSHALTKHLPIPVQYKVMSEFARVSRRWVVCSFSVLTISNYGLWRFRDIEESYPLLRAQIEDLAKLTGLAVRSERNCTTPVGVERSILFEKTSRV
jgi:ubiquinone/menaquinone biosynthesis C-methylase UbiE